jgi:hypothetical protein
VARQIKADSLDSTQWLWSRKAFADFVAYVTEPDPQGDLLETG